MKISKIMLFIYAFILCSCTIKEKRYDDYNLILLVSDALRADALSCYGGEAKTPNISKLANEGVLFENAYSNASYTLPSAISLLTGNYAAAYSHTNKLLISEESQKFYFVNDNEILLAEELKDRGYDVFYDLENPLVASPNILQGFRDIKEYKKLDPKEHKNMASIYNIKDKSSWYYQRNIPILFYLRNTNNNFYLFKWIMDPHSVYSPPERFNQKINVDSSKLIRDKKFYEKIGAKNDKNLRAALEDVGPTFTDYEMYYLKELYFKEIESVDERIGQIINALEYNNLKDKTFIVFTSDHGEGFGEHGKFFHGEFYYEELIHVPLIITGPGIVRGKRIEELVSLIDIMPTLKDLLKADCLHYTQGKSLKPLLKGKEDARDNTAIYIKGGGQQFPIDAIRFKNHKLIFQSDNNLELYDLRLDPEELQNISEKKPELLAELIEKIKLIRRENKHKRQENIQNISGETLDKIDKKTLERLRALGYIK